MKILKLILITASALKIINYIEDMSEVICMIDASREEWEDNLMQVEWDEKKWYVVHYKSEIWSDVEKHYNARKWECKNILKMLKKCCNYLYKIHFILEFNANILIAQLNWLANNLLKVFMTN